MIYTMAYMQILEEVAMKLRVDLPSILGAEASRDGRRPTCLEGGPTTVADDMQVQLAPWRTYKLQVQVGAR